MMLKRCLQICLPALGLALTLSAQAGPSGSFKIALTGDSIINRRISVYDEPPFLQMIDRLRKADAAFTNFETLVHNFDLPGAPLSGGAYQGSPAYVIDELKWAGINLFCFANNHGFDFGTEGLLNTMRALEKAGVVYAGAGDNLARARAPGYLETKNGRVALIAAVSTLTALMPAGEQRPDMVGRPGMNPIRFQTAFTIEPATMAALRDIAKVSGAAPASADTLRLFGQTFRTGDKVAVQTAADPTDLKGITAYIHDARRQADWVVVSLHTHEPGPGGRNTPADFFVQYAHAAVDAGGDVIVCHGPHVLRGIEIYKGKPIFYSLSNFLFQNETLPFQPHENMAGANLPMTATVADWFDNRSGNDTRGFPADIETWESIIADATFNSKRELTEINVYPITLGYKTPRPYRGRPMFANAEQAKRIMDQMIKLSAPFGTKITFDGTKGVWRAQ